MSGPVLAYLRDVGTADDPCWVPCAKGDPGWVEVCDRAAFDELIAFAKSFSITVTDSYYLDAYLHINRPDKACVYRLPTPSSMSPDLAEIERMRVSALGSAA